MVGLISQVEGTREATSSAGDSVPEAAVRVNRGKASAYGITSAQIADVINRAVTGNVVTEYKVEGGELDVRIRQDEQSLEYINDLKNIRLTTATGAGIPLSEVADITVEDGPVSIDRYNQQRYITVGPPFSGAI
jgi:HAE1 family hydrophobic/amphiphilic exporter-1